VPLNHVSVFLGEDQFEFNSSSDESSGFPLMAGEYKLLIFTPAQALEPEEIWPVIGKDYSNLTGPLVTPDPLMKMVEYKSVIKIP